jgi:hypothetical protein
MKMTLLDLSGKLLSELMQYVNDIVNSIIHASLFIYNISFYLATHTNFLSP